MLVWKNIRLVIVILLCVIGCSIYLGNAEAGKVPPKEFAVWNRLPGEGTIGYGFNALRGCKLLENPRGTTVVASVASGEPILERKTVAFTFPRLHPVKLYSSYSAKYTHHLPDNATSINYNKMPPESSIVIPAGETIYLLMYTGEGTYMAWYDGNIVEWVEAFNIKNFISSNKARPPYMGEYLGNDMITCEYWMQFKKSDGTLGWFKDERGLLKIDWNRFQKVKD